MTKFLAVCLISALCIGAVAAQAAEPAVARPNLALGRPVKTFSSLENSGWNWAKLTDGRKGGLGWSSKAFSTMPDHSLYPEFATVDLGSTCLVDRVDLYPRGAGAMAGQGFPEDFTIQLCAAGEKWQTIVAERGYAQPKDGNPQAFSFTPAPARYVKVEATRLRAVGQRYYFQLAQIEVFGKPAANLPSAPAAPPVLIPPRAVNLRCEYRIDPAGIDASVPHLSWTMEGNARGQKQTAYRVLVAESLTDLDTERDSLWDSGEIESDRSIALAYAGKPLRAGARCYWKVMLWDKDRKPAPWSQPANFTMGKLQPADWKGKWIGASEDPKHAAVYLRKEVDVSRPVRRATAFFSGLGWSELYINGAKVSDWVLSPGRTSYHVRTPYLVFDVTDRFTARGRTAIGVILGDGWYALEKDPWVHRFEKLPYVDKPKLLLDIELEFADGSTQVIRSDESWKWSYGPITKNWVAVEHIDMRKTMPGWDQPGYADLAWQPVASVNGPAGKLVCQKEPPTRVIATIKPQRLSQDTKTGSWNYEFGREFQGWVQFRTSGPAGTTINIIVDPPKRQAQGNNHGYSNQFILAGKGIEQYVPRFNYNSVSSIEIQGATHPPALDDLVGCQVNADLQTAGYFRSSDDVLNWLNDAVIRTFMSYVTGVPNDSTREKKGWPQDAQSCFRAAAYLFDTQSLFERWQTDIIGDQAPDGNCPNITPGPFFDAWNSPWFGGVVVWLPWQSYQVYGDRRILADSYPAMKKYVDFLTKTGKDYMQDWGLSDWLAIEDSPRMVVNTPAYYLYAQIVSQAAAMLGNPEDAKTYAALAQTIKRKFNAKFLYAKTGVYNVPDAKPIAGVGGAAGNSTLTHRIWWQPGEPVCTQGAQTLALALGLVPDDVRKTAQESLLKEIAAHDGYLSTGFISSLYMLDILSDLAPQVGQAMVDKRSAPSWYAMTAGTDSDLLRETWSGEAVLLPDLGCGVAFWNFYALGGIRPDPSGPGFKKIIVKPNMPGDLHWVDCHYDSVYGRIVSNWKLKGRQLTLDVTIPANTTATIYVPTSDVASVRESGQPAAEAAGLIFRRYERGRAVYEAAAGVYQFAAVLAEK